MCALNAMALLHPQKKKRPKRINWRSKENIERLERILDSFENKNDLWKDGDSTRGFCKRFVFVVIGIFDDHTVVSIV